MSPYPEVVEIEGLLVEAGAVSDQPGYGVRVETDDGPITVSGLDEIDVERMLPGILGRVRIIIEPIDDPDTESEKAALATKTNSFKGVKNDRCNPATE